MYKVYEVEGLDLTDNFKKSTEAYFKDISKDRAWFDTILLKDNTKDARICLKTLRLRFCEDNGVSRSANWFSSKCKEYFGEQSIKTNCLGYGVDMFNPSNYGYYKGDNKNKVKGMMLDGFIINPTIFVAEEESDDEVEEEIDAPVNMVIKKKHFKYTSTSGITGFLNYK